MSREHFTTLIIAEKPSVARDIAHVVKAHQRHSNHFQNQNVAVTWAIGHLVTLPEPHQIHPAWKSWNLRQLPMLPREWPLVVIEKTRPQFETICRLLEQSDEIVCATDAGREGELIFRYIYERAQCQKPVRRLWISSLTPEAIALGLKQLKPAQEYNALADAARARSRADWLVGMNLSRAYALTTSQRIFVGRVQTPTLAMVVERDREVENFTIKEYAVLRTEFSYQQQRYVGRYIGNAQELEKPLQAKDKHLNPDEPELELLIEATLKGQAHIFAVEGKTLRDKPPQLYDLTELQRDANRHFGFSAAHTLQTAQNLYEKHKLITYPRTDCRYLSSAVALTLPTVVAKLLSTYPDVKPDTGQTPLGERFVDDTQIGDHHAIIPTGVARPLLNKDEQSVYDLICRRLLMAWQNDYTTDITTVLTAVKLYPGSLAEDDVELFKTLGTVVRDRGWKILERRTSTQTTSTQTTSAMLPSGLEAHQPVTIDTAQAIKRKTEPPPRLTDATLLTAMENAGRHLQNAELPLMQTKDIGIGTPATRAATIETLIARGYLLREGKSLVSTPLGQQVVSVVHPSIKSAELTAKWENKLAEIQKNKLTLTQFLSELEAEIRVRVKEIVGSPPRPPAGGQGLTLATRDGNS